MRLPPALADLLRSPRRAWFGAALTALAFALSFVPARGGRAQLGAVTGERDRGAAPERRRDDGRSTRVFERGDAFADEAALIAPLAVGDRLGPGRITELAHRGEGWLLVGADVAGRAVWVLVCRAAGSVPAVPLVRGSYGVRVFRTDAPAGDTEATVRAVAEALAPHADAPLPGHMGPYIERAR